MYLDFCVILQFIINKLIITWTKKSGKVIRNGKNMYKYLILIEFFCEHQWKLKFAPIFILFKKFLEYVNVMHICYGCQIICR